MAKQRHWEENYLSQEHQTIKQQNQYSNPKRLASESALSIYSDNVMLPQMNVVRLKTYKTKTNGFDPEVDGNVAKVDTVVHALTSVVHEQPPQESEHLTTMHTLKVLQHELTSSI